MSKNIIVLSDGTGNAASSFWRTNVWRTFQAINLEGNEQVAKYDDGVGTSSFLPLALLGGAFGWGLKRNILDAYEFICRNYEKDAKIFLFGFSRGAFTVRVLAALILDQGLVQAESEAERHNLARAAYRAYRASRYHTNLHLEKPLRLIRDTIMRVYDRVLGRQAYDVRQNIQVPHIEFIGVWDTVAAYGFPADEMTRGFSNWIWPLELPNRVLSPRVRCARHALALDDERTTFHPILWTEASTAQAIVPAPEAGNPASDLVQVWFAGMHSNVGGGYPDDALAFVPLVWMMKEAAKRGLTFKSTPDDDPDAMKAARSGEDKDGRLYDSRSGLGAYYRYGPRSAAALCNDRDNDVRVPIPKIHASVFGRIDSGCNAYAPIGLPEAYTVATDAGVQPPALFESPAQAAARISIQERIWNYVWLRRIVYFLSLAATFHIAAFWLFHPLNPSHEFTSYIRLVSESVRLIDSVLPRAFHWWTDWYAANPEWFAGGILLIVFFTLIGSALSAKISDSMRIAWRSKGAVDPLPQSFTHSVISAVRNNKAYQWFIRSMRLHALPFMFFLSIIWFVLFFGSHATFNIADSMGAFCHGTKDAVLVSRGADQRSLREFETGDFCAATGLKVKEGYSYRITIQITNPWDDRGFPVLTPMGFHTSQHPGWDWPILYPAIPLRRVIFRPWFKLIARIGETGVDEYFLDPVLKKIEGQPDTTYTDEIKALRSGELFLYVNDAAIALPWFYKQFYGNNHGSAKISVRLL
jgi:uncharacterized protein (DUF2235 family)